MIEGVNFCRHWDEVLDASQLSITCFCDTRCPECYQNIGKRMNTWEELKH
jgi:hypothetical protein